MTAVMLFGWLQRTFGSTIHRRIPAANSVDMNVKWQPFPSMWMPTQNGRREAILSESDASNILRPSAWYCIARSISPGSFMLSNYCMWVINKHGSLRTGPCHTAVRSSFRRWASWTADQPPSGDECVPEILGQIRPCVCWSVTVRIHAYVHTFVRACYQACMHLAFWPPSCCVAASLAWVDWILHLCKLVWVVTLQELPSCTPIALEFLLQWLQEPRKH